MQILKVKVASATTYYKHG